MKVKTVRPSEAECLVVLELVKDRFPRVDPRFGDLALRMEWDWAHPDGWPAITWEEGPEAWALDTFFVQGLPDGVWLEPYSPWAVSIFKDVAHER